MVAGVGCLMGEVVVKIENVFQAYKFPTLTDLICLRNIKEHELEIEIK